MTSFPTFVLALRARRLLAPLVVVASLLALLPAAALAHARLKHSNPASGARLATPPAALRLTFTEASELAVTRVQLLGAGGRAVALAPLTGGGDEGRTIVAAIRGPVAAGTYTVVWQVVGRDGHPVRGRFTFSVAPGAPAASDGQAADSAGATRRATPASSPATAGRPAGHR